MSMLFRPRFLFRQLLLVLLLLSLSWATIATTAATTTRGEEPPSSNVVVVVAAVIEKSDSTRSSISTTTLRRAAAFQQQLVSLLLPLWRPSFMNMDDNNNVDGVVVDTDDNNDDNSNHHQQTIQRRRYLRKERQDDDDKVQKEEEEPCKNCNDDDDNATQGPEPIDKEEEAETTTMMPTAQPTSHAPSSIPTLQPSTTLQQPSSSSSSLTDDDDDDNDAPTLSPTHTAQPTSTNHAPSTSSLVPTTTTTTIPLANFSLTVQPAVNNTDLLTAALEEYFWMNFVLLSSHDDNHNNNNNEQKNDITIIQLDLIRSSDVVVLAVIPTVDETTTNTTTTPNEERSTRNHVTFFRSNMDTSETSTVDTAVEYMYAGSVTLTTTTTRTTTTTTTLAEALQQAQIDILSNTTALQDFLQLYCNNNAITVLATTVYDEQGNVIARNVVDNDNMNTSITPQQQQQEDPMVGTVGAVLVGIGIGVVLLGMCGTALFLRGGHVESGSSSSSSSDDDFEDDADNQERGLGARGRHPAADMDFDDAGSSSGLESHDSTKNIAPDAIMRIKATSLTTGNASTTVKATTLPTPYNRFERQHQQQQNQNVKTDASVTRKDADAVVTTATRGGPIPLRSRILMTLAPLSDDDDDEESLMTGFSLRTDKTSAAVSVSSSSSSKENRVVPTKKYPISPAATTAATIQPVYSSGDEEFPGNVDVGTDGSASQRDSTTRSHSEPSLSYDMTSQNEDDECSSQEHHHHHPYDDATNNLHDLIYGNDNAVPPPTPTLLHSRTPQPDPSPLRKSLGMSDEELQLGGGIKAYLSHLSSSSSSNGERKASSLKDNVNVNTPSSKLAASLLQPTPPTEELSDESSSSYNDDSDDNEDEDDPLRSAVFSPVSHLASSLDGMMLSPPANMDGRSMNVIPEVDSSASPVSKSSSVAPFSVDDSLTSAPSTYSQMMSKYHYQQQQQQRPKQYRQEDAESISSLPTDEMAEDAHLEQDLDGFGAQVEKARSMSAPSYDDPLMMKPMPAHRKQALQAAKQVVAQSETPDREVLSNYLRERRRVIQNERRERDAGLQ